MSTFRWSDRPEALDRLIASLHARYPGLPILIADHGHQPVRRHDAQILRLPADAGLSAARNAAVQAARPPLVLILDDDYCLTDQTNVEAMQHVLGSHDLDAVAGHARTPNRPVLMGHFHLDRHTRTLHLQASPYATIPSSPSALSAKSALSADTSPVHVVHYAANFLLAHRRALLRCPWDPRLKIGEHLDWAIRVWQTGFRLAVLPTVWIDDTHDAPTQAYRQARARARHYRDQSLARSRPPPRFQQAPERLRP